MNARQRKIQRSLQWQRNNPDRVAEIHRRYRRKHANRIAKRRAEYRKANRAKIAAYAKKYHAQLPAGHPVKLAARLRTRLTKQVRRGLRGVSAVRDCGCTMPQLIRHLERQFKPGMTWKNWSPKGWHIDHKKALSSFNLARKSEALKAVHFTNLQPLWQKDHAAKTKLDRRLTWENPEL